MEFVEVEHDQEHKGDYLYALDVVSDDGKEWSLNSGQFQVGEWQLMDKPKGKSV